MSSSRTAAPDVTPAQLRALEVLAKVGPSYDKPTPSSWFAQQYWPDSPSWKRSSRQGVHGQFMPALGARLLYRLVKKGLACHTSREGSHQALFYISGRGREVLARSKTP